MHFIWELGYTLCQINDINPDRVDNLVKLIRDNKLTRQGAIKELNVLKGKLSKNARPVNSAAEPPKENCNTDALMEQPGTATQRNGNNASRMENGGNEKIPETQSGNAVPEAKTTRVVVRFEDREGYLLTDRIPKEYGQVWIELPLGGQCIDAAEITILGIKEV